ncbi:hypothetical protein QQZ08_007875 [Neonectria magnoliae]|uniref:Uncharacterized protein n=1 Tax=Neonectria magnoliae TaxID=2732573 RepID=A0ABR1HXY0_9HYPO
MRFPAGIVAITAAMANTLVPAIQISATNLPQFMTGTGPATTLIVGITQVITLSSSVVGNEALSNGGASGGADTDKLLASIQ